MLSNREATACVGVDPQNTACVTEKPSFFMDLIFIHYNFTI